MLPYIMNFDLKKVAEINKKGLKAYEEAKTNRKDEKEKITRLVLDSDDILILRFIYTVGKGSKTIRDSQDKEFFWVKYDALFSEYQGLLLLTKSALNTRLNKYVKMNLIERKCVKNADGSFSFFKLTGITNLIYIPVDSTGSSVTDGQVHFTEIISENAEFPTSTKSNNSEEESDFTLRIELIEEVLTTKANKALKDELKKFESQSDFFIYFDNFILPLKEARKKNTCKYMINNVKLYLNGEFNI